jgi:hypothetical protein
MITHAREKPINAALGRRKAEKQQAPCQKMIQELAGVRCEIGKVSLVKNCCPETGFLTSVFLAID